MRHGFFALAFAWLLSGCGVLIDGVYLISGKRYSTDVEQSKRTELTQASFEHVVRAEQGQLWLACEDVERSIERTWTVRKQYEHQGGLYRAHWLPLILDTVIASALTIGFGVECGKTGASGSCNGLWGAVPLWADAVYSGVRLLTIDPPKLVGKERRSTSSRPSPTPNWRRTVSCEPDATLIIGRGPADPLAAFFRVDAWGALPASERPRLVTALLRDGVQVYWAAGGQPPQQASLGRCEALRGLGSACPETPAR